ncbi:MAG: rhomboid family intramembrane serine protease [Candidatus Nanopelagicales bacterium]
MSTPDSSSAPGVPVCYRHPDRETYIRCARCDRPICPDCMTSASVGFQCPECIDEGRKSVREVRTRLGAKVPTKPYITYSLIVASLVGFGLQYLGGFDSMILEYGMLPIAIADGNEYYRLITSMFLHGSLLHIGFNMLVLWSLGPSIENLLGHLRYATLYLLAGLGGSVASFWFTGVVTPSIGASGAIYGLFGAWVVIGRRLNLDLTQVVGLIAINLVIGFVVPNVDWRAHLGGLVTGAVVAAVFAYAPRGGRTAVQIAGVVVVLALLVAATVVRDAAISSDPAVQDLLAQYGQYWKNLDNGLGG